MGDTGSGAFGLVYHCSEAAFVRMRGESEKLNGSKCNRLNLIGQGGWQRKGGLAAGKKQDGVRKREWIEGKSCCVTYTRRVHPGWHVVLCEKSHLPSFMTLSFVIVSEEMWGKAWDESIMRSLLTFVTNAVSKACC